LTSLGFPLRAAFWYKLQRQKENHQIATAMPVKRASNARYSPGVEHVQLPSVYAFILLPFNLIHFFFLGDINGIANSLRLFTSSFQSFHFLKKKKTKKKKEKQKTKQNQP